MVDNDSPSKMFLGVRFVLFGFDAVNKNKVRSKLLDCGGQDVGQYSQNCTHVIVDKIVYDDPVCRTARNDGKTVVTGLWVDHSFDIGMPVDATSVMYRPLRDLNGIPGAKSLIICLTGYQRQDRDDIMTMVGLMGSQFSKPLVANKVTHLICYKFEGEKYELANKMKKIKLVNHRWLEDCLRDWKLLPEIDYCKSGYEMEMMEAEAKDSEEDAYDNSVKQSTYQNVNRRSPQNLNIGNPEACGKVPPVQHNLIKSGSPLSVVHAKDMLSTPGNKKRSDHALGFDGICVSNVPGYVGTLQEATSVELPDQHETTPKSTKTDDDLESVPRSVKKEECPKQGIDTSDLIPQKGSDLLFKKSTGKRRKSYAGAKSQEMSHDTRPCLSENLSVSYKNHELDPKSVVDGLPKIYDHSPRGSNGPFLHDGVCANSAQDSRTVVLATKLPKRKTMSFTEGLQLLDNVTSETRKDENIVKKALQESLPQLGESSLADKLEVGDHDAEKSKHVVEVEQKPHNQRQYEEVPSCYSRKLDTEKSDTLVKLGMAEEENDISITKRVRKKMIAKKTLGSRAKLKTHQKGSIYLNINPAQNYPLIGTSMGKERVGSKVDETPLMEVKEWFSNGNELETSSATASISASADVQTKAVLKPGDIEKKADFMDDETEAPDEMVEYVNELGKEKLEVVDLSHNVNDEMKLNPEGTYHVASNSVTACMHDGAMDGKGAVGLEKKIELAAKGDDIKERLIKGKKQPAGKTQQKTFRVAPKNAKSEKVLDREESHDDMNIEEKCVEKKGEPPLSGKRKSRTVVGNKSDSSMEVEKENMPVADDLGTSQFKHQGGKTGVASDKNSLQNQRGIKSNPSSTSMKQVSRQLKTEPVCFILSGHKLQRKEFQQVIRRLRGKFCRDSHHWSYQATHFIAPDRIRRTEKFFAAAAAGRWILKTDYLTASSQAGSFLAEEPYEWNKNGLSEDGAINLEAPRKWRLLRERTGHGAFYGMRIIIYGECITPPLDTLKRVVKAGDGTILATSPPYTRFLSSGVDYAIVSPGMPRVDMWVQEFIKHEIPCVLADYLVEYVCKPGFPLERHVLYNTNAWAGNSFANLLSKAEEVVDYLPPSDDSSSNDIACQVCGSRDRGEVMLICGDESGSVGCGLGLHIDCCDPPLEDVPEEDWFCSSCSSRGRKRGSSCLSKKRNKSRLH